MGVCINENKYFLYENRKSDLLKLLKITNSQQAIADKFKEVVLGINVYTGTFHASKGTEADITFICMDYPNKIKNITDDERRALYVAITRTKERIIFFEGFTNGTLNNVAEQLKREVLK